jgi:hypothetical protein
MFRIPDHYKYDLVFMGDVKTHWIRPLLRTAMNDRMSKTSYCSKHYSWAKVYSRSKFVLCPRGFGRNSFRLGEVLQMGMVPVYVYTDLIWLPYYDAVNWSDFSLVLRWDEFNKAIPRFKKTNASDVRRMRMRITEMYPTHFSPAGVWRQIFAFLQQGFGGSDLRCAPYTHLRDLVPDPSGKAVMATQ